MTQRRSSAIAPHMVDGSDDGASYGESTHYIHSPDKGFEKGTHQHLEVLRPMDHLDHGDGCPFFQEKIELTQADGYKSTGFAFPTWKKWGMISVIFIVQCSMNMNASLYGNAVDGMMEVCVSDYSTRV